MAEKVRIKRKKPPRVHFTAADFAHPDEARARLIAIGVGVGFAAVVLALLALTPLRTQLMAAWGGWVLLALIFYTIAADRRELRRLGVGGKRGQQAPEQLADIVRKQTRAVGVAAEVAITQEGAAAMTVRGVILIPEGVRQRLTPAEMWVLIAREVGRIKAGDVGLGNLSRRLDTEERALLRLLALPLRPLARALANWRWYAELTADHMALILTRDRKVVAAALLKQAAMGVEGVTVAEIDAYLNRPGGLIAQSAEVTTHFKLGEVLRARGDLMQRLRATGQYADADEYRAACAKLDAAHRKAQKTQAGAPTGPSARADDSTGAAGSS